MNLIPFPPFSTSLGEIVPVQRCPSSPGQLSLTPVRAFLLSSLGICGQTVPSPRSSQLKQPVNSKNNQDCPFCEIVSRDDPDVREIFRNVHVVAFFPTDPATLGHTLIVPRRHVDDIWGLRDEEASDLARATLRIAEAIRKSIAPDGLNIIQSNGSAATQTVPHVHVHLVPRWHDDNIGKIWPPETSYSERQKDSAWSKLKGEVRRLTNKGMD